MATSEMQAKYDTSTAFTITLNALASSTVGVGRQSTLVSFGTPSDMWLQIYLKITQGIGPTSNRSVFLHWIFDDDQGTDHRSDGAGASDAAITILNAPILGAWTNDSSADDNEIIYGEARIHLPGATGGVAVVHNTGVNLAGSGNWCRYRLITPENQ